MRNRISIAAAMALCCSLVVGVTPAAERQVDHLKERSKNRQIISDSPNARGAVDMSQSFGEGNRALVTRPGATAFRSVEKAAALVTAAQQGQDVATNLDAAVRLLADEDTELANKVRLVAYEQLAENTADPSKRATYLNIAMQNAADEGTRARLQAAIVATGGQVVDLTIRPDVAGATQRTVGVADTCEDALPFTIGDTQVVTIVNDGSVDHDWFSVDVNTASGGANLTIQTISDEGLFADDTDLTLWASCDAFNNGDPPIAFNDDALGDFTSLIETSCLPNGTYFVEVGGWNDSADPDNFDLVIEQAAECTPPTPDVFEPDADRENATLIGRLVSGNPFGLFKGTIKKEIQAHNFFPSPDNDFVKFFNLANELVQIETDCGFPTVFNDFTACEDPPGDTVVQLLTNTPENYAGLCNDQSIGFGPVCTEDLDCDANGNGDPFDDLVDPVVGLPACIPAGFFTFWPFGLDPVFAVDDDGGRGLASKLEICLPSGVRPFSPSAMVANEPGDDLEYFWYVNVFPFSAAADFDYEIFVHNQTRCEFEQEPNNTFDEPSALNVNGRTSGIYDFSEVPDRFFIDAGTIFFTPDNDVYNFDVDQDSRVILETNGYSTSAVDTFIELFVGPDAAGDFFDLAVSDDDGGDGFLSRVDVLLPPAADLLGVTLPPADQAACDNAPPAAPWWWPDFLPWWGDLVPVPDYCGPDYLLVVRSNYLNPNFPYDVNATVLGDPIAEVEPNEDCETNSAAASLNDTFIGAIDEACDLDTYKFTVGPKSSFVRIETFATDTGASDTAIQLVDCDTGDVLACDDDSSQEGLRSAMQGCLPAGEYCVQVRAFSSGSGPYELAITGGDICLAEEPPIVSGDGAFTCNDFETCP